jgi:lysozyme family protein
VKDFPRLPHYSDAFNIALRHVLEFEGGWSDHPDDPGGKTFAGITLATLRRAWNNSKLTGEDLRMLTPSQIAKIYHDMYWLPVKGDDLPMGLALQVFDASVNSGPANAIKALQEALKAAGHKVKVDSRLGPITLQSVAKVALPLLVRKFAARRMVFYGLLTGTFKVFGFGWADRLMAAIQRASAIAAAASDLLDDIKKGD